MIAATGVTFPKLHDARWRYKITGNRPQAILATDNIVEHSLLEVVNSRDSYWNKATFHAVGQFVRNWE
jgi:hypothetical protein